jgi:hypothetical protein
MQNHKTRLTVIAGATMALVIASTAAVAAAGPRDDDRGFGPGKGRIGAQQGMKAMPRLGGMRGFAEDFERKETIIQTADGTTARRVEQGVVDSAADAALSFTLGSGEAVTVIIDEDTQAVALEEQTVTRRGWNRERLVPTEIEVAAIEAGAEIVVWSDSEDDGDFVASRIVVRPAVEADEDAEAADETEAEAEASAADAETSAETPVEDAPVTDA